MKQTEIRDFCLTYLRDHKQLREPSEPKPFTFMQDINHLRRSIAFCGVGCIKPRHISRLIKDHFPWRVAAAVAAFGAVAIVQCTTGLGYTQEAAVTLAPKQVADTDHHKRSPHTIINKSNGDITITFTDCRENDKHHVSCKFTDPTGEEHWTYLAGLTLPSSK
jgi:hypothetical protein